MGTDIHLCIEIKPPRDDEWECYGAEVAAARDYKLFGVLAGLRGGTAMIAPRGFPDDADTNTQWAWENHGDHTPSWLTFDEFKDAIVLAAAIRRESGQPEMDVSYKVAVVIMAAYAEEGYDTRIVFWFDS